MFKLLYFDEHNAFIGSRVYEGNPYADLNSFYAYLDLILFELTRWQERSYMISEDGQVLFWSSAVDVECVLMGK